MNEYINSHRRATGNNNAPDIIMTTPPANTVQIRQISTVMETENKAGNFIHYKILKINFFKIPFMKI